MIDPSYVRIMAAYNAEMNRRVLAAAAPIPDDERRAPQGVFWGSLHGTLCHLLWADRMWMWRFDGWDKPATLRRDSAGLVADFGTLAAERRSADAAIEAWAARIRQDWLDERHTFLGGDPLRPFTHRGWVMVTHFFNHQTHHRGQIHALLTRAGQDMGDTDLPLVVPMPD